MKSRHQENLQLVVGRKYRHRMGVVTYQGPYSLYHLNNVPVVSAAWANAPWFCVQFGSLSEYED